jgi:hypothetical protein
MSEGKHVIVISFYFSKDENSILDRLYFQILCQRYEEIRNDCDCGNDRRFKYND